jgi:GT2 family glycosyltransferase
MDNDIITVQKEWLSLIVSELEKDPVRGIGSGKHTFPNGNLQLPYIEADRKDDNSPAKGKYEFVKEVKGFFGPCIVIKREVIKKIGFYDENFFYGPNDIDYCLRAGKSGFKIVYNGNSHSVHIGSVSGLSPMKDFIYLKQSESMMIYSFRYSSTIGKIAMVFRQLIRALITRKAPIERIERKNLIFHWKSLPKRIFYFFIALPKSLNAYPVIKSSDYKLKIKDD